MAILKFNSYARQKNGEEYCSEVESYAQNMIEGKEDNAKVFYPSKTEFATFRSPSYNVTTDTLHIMLPYPIYKVVRVLMKPVGVKVGGGYPYTYFKKNGNEYIPNVTKYFVTDKEWDALPDLSKLSGKDEYYGSTLAKSNTIPYSIGSKEIFLSSYEAKRPPLRRDQPAYVGMIHSALIDSEALSYTYDYNNTSSTLDDLKLSDQAYGQNLKDVDARNWEYQIEYIPMVSDTKIKAVKAEPMPIKYTQVVNQRAEVNNAEAFGKYLHETAQKTGTEKLAIAKQYTKLADVPPVGALVTHKGERYRIVANSWNVTNTTMFTVTHLMSKNWSSKSKHVAVDQKYRNWDIPFDSYIWRTIYYEEYVCISSTEGTTQSSFNEEAIAAAFNNFFRCEPNTMEMRHLFLAKGDNILDWTGTVVSINAQGVGNSMVFSASMQDNISAGLKIAGEEDGNRYCKDVIYCNNDGTLERGFIILSNAMHAGEYYFADAYPEAKYSPSESKYYNIPTTYKNTHYFIDNFWIDKDPGEALKFTIQVHFMAQEPWIIVGNKLAQDHPFVNDNNGDGRVLQLWLLPYYIREGTDILENTEGGFKKILFAENVGMYINSAGGHGGKLDITSAIFMEAQAENPDFVPKCWVITDTEGNIYIGSNDINKREMYFTWKRNAELNAKVEYEPDGPNNPDGPDIPEEPEEPEEPDEPDVPEEPVVDTIEFSIGDTVCTAEKNMTWEAWALSGYCPDGIELELGTTKIMVSETFSGEATTKYVSYNGSFVARTDGIVSGREYSLIENEIITFSINGIEFTAEEGMTWKGWLESDYSTQVAGGIVTMDGDERVFVKEEISGEENVYNFITLDGKFVVKTSQIINGEEYSFMTKEHEDNYVIAFYIRNRQFTAGVNMTWRQFIDSDEYYSAGLAYYTNSNRVFVEKAISGVTTNNYVTYNGKFVPSMSEIVAGRSYNFNTIETDEPVPNGTLVAPDEPWQTVSDNAATATGTYVFDSGIHNIEDGYHRAEVSFTSNGKTFSSIATKWDSVAVTPTINIYYDDTLVYNGNTWEAEAYKTINFGGGAVVPKFVYELLYNYASRKYSTNTLEYDLSFDGTYYVCKGFGGVDGAGAVGAINLAVPDSYLGKPVKYINDGVFRGKNMNVGTVTIGNNVERIGINAFNWSKLTAVTLGNGLKTIAEGAFEECDGLTSIVIPAGVESIGARAFYGCSKLTTVQVPSSVTYIGASTDENGVVYGAFGGCDRLATVIYGGTKDELAAICKDAVVTQTFNWGVTYECSDGTLIT